MPPDTLHINAQSGPPPPQVNLDTVVSGNTMYIIEQGSDVVQEIILVPVTQKESYRVPRKDEYDGSGNEIFIVLLCGVFLITFSKKARTMLGRIAKEVKLGEHGPEQMPKVMNPEKKTLYSEWLRKYNPYYNSLSVLEQERFLNRTIEFMEEKEFRFHSMVEEEYIPVLISAAAIQITFGMSNYLMPYFPVIHVIRKEYVLDVDKETYYGHVSRNGIYISWNHFLEGYQDYNDSVNIGLHEMAHAVSYDAFLGYEDKFDAEFKQRLEHFVELAKPVFRSMRNGKYCVLDPYGTINMDEFWAVCIETFFENASGFRVEFPELYQSLVELLNQDPLKPHKIVDYQHIDLGLIHR